MLGVGGVVGREEGGRKGGPRVWGSQSGENHCCCRGHSGHKFSAIDLKEGGVLVKTITWITWITEAKFVFAFLGL